MNLSAPGFGARHWAAEDVTWDARAMAVSAADVSAREAAALAVPPAERRGAHELEPAEAAPSPGRAGASGSGRASGSRGRGAPSKAKTRTCQVPHCGVVLDSATSRAYNLRYRLCVEHLRAETVVLDNQAMRFCQKCSRFEPLAVFRGTTHTCRKMLERHNQRRQLAARREGSAGGGGAAEVAPSTTGGTGTGTGTRSISGGSSGGVLEQPEQLDALLRDTDALEMFLDTLPTVPGQGTDSAFAAALLGYPLPGAPPGVPDEAAAGGARGGPPVWQVADLERLQAAAGGAPGAAPVGAAPVHPLLQVVVSHIKLHDIEPGDLPRQMSDLVRAWLGPFVLDALAYIRPGCTLLTVHALMPVGSASQDNSCGAALALAQTLVAVAPERVARSRFQVHDPAGRVARAEAGAVTDCGVPAAAPQPGLPPLRPLALCSREPGALATALPSTASGRLRAYCGGALLPMPAGAEQVAAGDAVAFQLDACGWEGVALFELDDDAAGEGVPPVSQRLRPVLLCRDAAVAAEVAALTDESDDALESIVLTIGHALAPAAPAAMVRMAARIAVQRRWPATLMRLLPALSALSAVPLPAGEDTLLHDAVRGGDPRIVVKLGIAGSAAGRVNSRGANATTPLHLAAMIRDPDVGEAVLSAMCSVDAHAPLAWFSARDASGRTPSQLAASCGGGGATGAALCKRLLAARAAAMEALQQAQDEQGIFELCHAVDVAAAALAASGCSQAVRDAIALLRCAEAQLPSAAPEERPGPSALARARALLRRRPTLRLPALRMPGSFEDVALERQWLAKTAAQCCYHDACVFAFCGFIHMVEMARLTPPEPSQLVAQIFCCAVLSLALPSLIVMRSEWFMRHREAVITVSRLAVAAAAPVWLRQGTLTTAPGYSGGWMSRFPLLFLTVRMPLHVALSIASFSFTLSAGSTGRMFMRVSCAIIDIILKGWFERSSRAHFLAVLSQGGKPCKSLKSD